MDEDDLETQTIVYSDLTDDLKDKVRENFRNDNYLVPDDWWEFIWENIVEMYKEDGIDLDSDSLQFDLYRDSIDFNGSIDIYHEKIKPLMSDKLHNYIDKEWLQDFSTDFETDEFGDSYVNKDIIYDDLKSQLFGDRESEDDENVLVPIDHEDDYNAVFDKYTFLQENKTAIEIKGKFVAAGMFFQTEIEIDIDEFNDLIDEFATDIETDVENELESIQDKFKDLLIDLRDYIKKDLNESHDYYYTDEYADEHFDGKEFEVTVDAEGNQIEIDDLDGSDG